MALNCNVGYAIEWEVTENEDNKDAFSVVTLDELLEDDQIDYFMSERRFGKKERLHYFTKYSLNGQVYRAIFAIVDNRATEAEMQERIEDINFLWNMMVYMGSPDDGHIPIEQIKAMYEKLVSILDFRLFRGKHWKFCNTKWSETDEQE